MRLLQQLFSSSKTIEVQGGSAPTPAVKSQEKADSRFHGRFKIKTRIVVYWEDIEGNTQKLRARGVDFSRAALHRSLDDIAGQLVNWQVCLTWQKFA